MKKRPICQMAAAFVVGLLIEYTSIPKSQLMKLFPDIPWEVFSWLFFGIVVLAIYGILIVSKENIVSFRKGTLGKGSLRKDVLRKDILRKTLVLAGCLLLGQTVMKEASTSYLPEHIEDGSSITVTGRIKKYEIKNNQIYYYLKTSAVYHDVMVMVKFQNKLSDSQVVNDDFQSNNSATTSVYTNNFVEVPTVENRQVAVGMTVQATGSLSKFPTPTNEGQFNQWLYYKSQNIDFSIKNATLQIVDDRKAYLSDGLCRLQQYLSEEIQVLAGEKYGGILTAMLFGDKASMDNTDKKLYQRQGIAHVMSISGLHISILGLGLYKLLCKCGCPGWLAAILGGAFVILFGILTGMSVSTLRAVIMYMLTMIARLYGRTYDMATAVSLAAMLVLLERPYAMFQSGMQFSFGAIFALILFDKLKREGLGKKFSKKVPSFLEGFFVSSHIQLVTLPVQLYHTFYFSIYSSLLNLFVIPTMSVILSLGMLATLWSVVFQGVLSEVSHFLIFPCKFLLWIYEVLCQLAEEIPGSVQVFGRPQWWQIVLYYLLLAVFCMGLKKANEFGRFVRSDSRASFIPRGIAHREDFAHRSRCSRCVSYVQYGVLALPVCMVLLLRPVSFSGAEITMLDVGQGESICIQLPDNKVILSDGGSTDVSKVGTYRIKPFLLANGISEVDAVFVSHLDEDHVSGIREILTEEPREIQIKTIVLPKTEEDEKLLTLIAEAESAGVPVQYVKMGDTCTFGDATFTCLWPKEGLVTKERNDYSAVFHLSFNQFQMLLTGDLSGEYEEELILNGDSLEGNGEELPLNGDLLGKRVNAVLDTGMECEVLKVAHHGSKYSTTADLLAKVQPQLAFISCGKDNSYGHPHKELLERLEEAGCKVLTTAECGSISLKMEEEIKVQSYCKPD